MSIVIWLLTLVLVLLSVFLVLIVLAQKSKSDGGVGAALGGGMTEATFGADTGNILATLTRNGAIAFFVICFGLYLAHISLHTAAKSDAALPTIEVPAVDAPAVAPVSETETTPEAASEIMAPVVDELTPATAEPTN